MRASIVQVRAEHLEHVAQHMRAADRDEVWAWARHDPRTALDVSLAAPGLAWAGLLDDEPVCLFGASSPSLLSGAASPWLLGTDRIDQVPVTFGRLSRVALGRMQAVWPLLANWTDARHERSHAWLRWLGFRLGEPQPMGALGLPFRPFAMGMQDV